MRAALERLRPDARGVIFSSSQDRRAQFILNRRTGPSDPEVHADWDDVIVFQSGVGTLRFGGRLIGARALSETERRGGQLDNALETKVSAGDVLRVPSGVPHQIAPMGDAPLVYLVMKLKAPLEILPETGKSDSTAARTDSTPR
jgi:mannose-6-phosphate isomerase-like protein (cupin superfamily)